MKSAWSAASLAAAVALFAACGSDGSTTRPLATAGVEAPAESAPPTQPAAGTSAEIEPDHTMVDDEVTAESTVEPSTAGTAASVPDTTAATAAPEPSADLAAWQTMAIVDVDGNEFALADLVGAPVFVEAFATWCPKCRAQLGDTQSAAAALGDEAVFVALSVETTLSADDVSRYAAENGFADIRFAVMSPELLAAFVDDLGNSVANAPSTPHVVIDARGHAGELHTGTISGDDIVAAMLTAGDA